MASNYQKQVEGMEALLGASMEKIDTPSTKEILVAIGPEAERLAKDIEAGKMEARDGLLEIAGFAIMWAATHHGKK